MADMMLADKAAFDAAVAATAADGAQALMIDFTATWCPPCQMIGPVFVAAAEANPTLTMKKVDVDANAEASQAAGIQCMPTFKIYKGGVEVEKMEGASKEKLEELVAKYKLWWWEPSRKPHDPSFFAVSLPAPVTTSHEIYKVSL